MRVRSMVASLALLLAGGAVATACASDPSGEGVTASDSTMAAGAEGFTATEIGGGEFTLSEELASKPVALWFWAPG